MAKNSITVELTGLAALKRQLEAVGVAPRAVMQAAALKGAEVVHDAAEPQAPGPHIEVAPGELTDRRASALVGPDEKHWYYRFFEFGAGSHPEPGTPFLVFEGDAGTIATRSVEHPGVAASPFLRPAVDEHKDEIYKAIAEVFEKAIREAVR